MKKRILSILLLCCMVLTLLPVTAFATGELRDSTNVTVTFDSAGGSAVEPQSVPQGQPAQRPADPVKEGYTFIGWYDKNDLDNKYYNMPEWNFRYSVTKDMVLVAQWMEPMPISTEPITYLDKDGNQQVCNKYTVLTSNTAGSILDLTDKWYDLPAGWYVVKGNVTFTPPLGHPRRGQSDIDERQPPHGGVGHQCEGGRYLHRLRPKHRREHHGQADGVPFRRSSLV